MKRKKKKRPIQAFKEQQVKTLPSDTGVYALCDLDEVPIYVGQSIDGIRYRVRRHLTSARSDPIANRQIDVWEIAYVWAWKMKEAKKITSLEAYLLDKYNEQSPLVNSDIPPKPSGLTFDEPERIRVQMIPEEEIKIRRDPALRFPRQIQHFSQLVDYILNTQDKPHLRQALKVYFDRLSRYYSAFLDEQNGK